MFNDGFKYQTKYNIGFYLFEDLLKVVTNKDHSDSYRNLLMEELVEVVKATPNRVRKYLPTIHIMEVHNLFLRIKRKEILSILSDNFGERNGNSNI